MKKLEKKKEKKKGHAWASLVGAKGSHWPLESVSLIAANANCQKEKQKQKNNN